MNLLERINHPSPAHAGPNDPEGGDLDTLAQQGAAFLAAGRDIINAALSGDSQAFLNANRQLGGQ